MSTQISEHFKLEEFHCNDGTTYPEEWVDSRLRPLVIDLEIIRSFIGRPLLITSAYRTPKYNKQVGGALFSAHTQGIAVDIKCVAIPARELYNYILKLIAAGKITNGGLGTYPSWVHYDHGKVRRWRY